MKIEYSSNNSGGSWWLKDDDWFKLERAGWWIEWGSSSFCHSKNYFAKKATPKICASADVCPGHRNFESGKDMTKGDRWLGCLAKTATKDFPSLRDAILEWEEVTGQDSSDEGCNCCGAPHTFNIKDAPAVPRVSASCASGSTN